MTFYEEQIGNLPSPTARDMLIEYTKDIGAEVVCRAIEIAVDARAFNWRYIESVLKAWAREKVKNLDDVRRIEAKRAAASKGSSTAGGKTVGTASKQTFADLAAELEGKS
jgi:DnaD/phage-associated family protein